MRPRLLTEQQQQEIVKIYTEQKLAAWKIGKMYNVTERPILRILNDAGIKKFTTKDYMSKVFTPEESSKIISDYKGGINTRDVAALMGVNRCTIEAFLKREGVEMRGGRSKNNNKEVNNG